MKTLNWNQIWFCDASKSMKLKWLSFKLKTGIKSYNIVYCFNVFGKWLDLYTR